MAEVKPFGCMVEAYPGKTGLVHVSELDVTRTADASECLCFQAPMAQPVGCSQDKCWPAMRVSQALCLPL